jgi:predicted metal-dependent hydrolase
MMVLKVETVSMMKPDTIQVDGVGKVLFERSSRAKHLNISVKPFRGVRVAVPYGMSFKNAQRTLKFKTDWIQKHLERVKGVEERLESMSKLSDQIDRLAARKRLIRRLDELSERYGLVYSKVFIRNQRTRWGSCSAKNNISLNAKLIMLPAELIDYVILHELVHTRIKNHSQKFWSELENLVANAKTLRAKLNAYVIP